MFAFLERLHTVASYITFSAVLSSETSGVNLIKTFLLVKHFFSGQQKNAQDTVYMYLLILSTARRLHGIENLD